MTTRDTPRPAAPVSALGFAWLFAVVTAAAFARLVLLAEEPVRGEHLVWLAACLVAAAAAGACAVLHRLDDRPA